MSGHLKDEHRHDMKTSSPCTGAYDCPAGQHIHGCHADFGSCDNPAEHWVARSTQNNISTFGSDGSQEPAETSDVSATSENGPSTPPPSSPATPEADR